MKNTHLTKTENEVLNYCYNKAVKHTNYNSDLEDINYWSRNEKVHVNAFFSSYRTIGKKMNLNRHVVYVIVGKLVELGIITCVSTNAGTLFMFK